MRTVVLAFALTTLTIVAVGCGGDGVDDPTLGMMPGPGATLTEIQMNVFTPRCALQGCHAGPFAPEGLVLEPGESFANLVNVQSGELPAFNRVTPGNPDDSYLIMKLTADPRIVLSPMPLVGARLTADEIRPIREWILDGAPDN